MKDLSLPQLLLLITNQRMKGLTNKKKLPRYRVHSPAGFTLAELLISIVIGLLILIIVSSAFVLNQKVFRKSNLKAELAQNGRITLDLMARELRQAKNIVTVLPADSSDPSLVKHELEFEDGHNTATIQYIRYYLTGTNLYRQIIGYYFATEPTVYVHWNDVDPFGGPSQSILENKLIGENFNSVSFFGTNDITIQLILTKQNEQMKMESIINPRNS